MKKHILIAPVLFLVLVCVIMISGCTSNTGNSVVTTVPTTLPAGTPATTSAGPQYLTYTNPTYQLTMSYPSDWQEQNVAPATCLAARPYGKTTCNIVNFFSPTVNGKYTTFSIDVDNPTTSTLATYFNNVTSAIENYYPGVQVVQTSFQEEISGNPSYELVYTTGQEGKTTPVPAIVEVTFGNTNVPYIISYSALDDQTFDNMVKSIQIATVTPTQGR
jgi:hypothetical protein